jgi:hypothetical protein
LEDQRSGELKGSIEFQGFGIILSGYSCKVNVFFHLKELEEHSDGFFVHKLVKLHLLLVLLIVQKYLQKLTCLNLDSLFIREGNVLS